MELVMPVIPRGTLTTKLQGSYIQHFKGVSEKHERLPVEKVSAGM